MPSPMRVSVSKVSLTYLTICWHMCCDGRGEEFGHRPCKLQDLRYLLSGPPQKKFTILCTKSINASCILRPLVNLAVLGLCFWRTCRTRRKKSKARDHEGGNLLRDHLPNWAEILQPYTFRERMNWSKPAIAPQSWSICTEGGPGNKWSREKKWRKTPSFVNLWPQGQSRHTSAAQVHAASLTLGTLSHGTGLGTLGGSMPRGP